MQFLIVAYDATDDDALARRMTAREAHIAYTDRFKPTGSMHMGAAILNSADMMIGSCMIVEFPSRAALDAWLAEEPYVTCKVWDKIDIMPCKIGPSFQK